MVSIADFVADIADFVAGVVAGGQGSVVGVAGIGEWWQARGIAGDIAVFAGIVAGRIAGIVAGRIAGFRFAVFAGILILDGAARLAWRLRMRGEQMCDIADIVAVTVAGEWWRQWSSPAALPFLPLFSDGE